MAASKPEELYEYIYSSSCIERFLRHSNQDSVAEVLIKLLVPPSSVKIDDSLRTDVVYDIVKRIGSQNIET